MARLRIEKPSNNKKKSSALPWLLLAVLAGAGAVYFFGIPVSQISPLEISNFSGAVEIREPGGEIFKPERGGLLLMGQMLTTGEGSEADLQLPGKVKIRIKANSEFVYSPRKFYEKSPPYRFQLNRGEAYAATEKDFNEGFIELGTPDLVARSSSGGYYLTAPAGEGHSAIGLLRGSAEIKDSRWYRKQWVTINGLESVEGGKDLLALGPRQITRDEWKQMSEIYELTQKSAALEAMQLDLSKEIGSLFDFVFDHGTFYTPKVGYAGREFFKDEDSGEVFLEIEYDVFTRGSFSGMYIKTRDLDLSGYETLEFEMRRVEKEGFPQSIRIELKSKSGIARAFAAKLPKPAWEKVSFPLHVRNETMMSEIAFVFLHDRVGEDKKGSVQFRRIHLIKSEANVQDVPSSDSLLPPQPVAISDESQDVVALPEMSEPQL